MEITLRLSKGRTVCSTQSRNKRRSWPDNRSHRENEKSLFLHLLSLLCPATNARNIFIPKSKILISMIKVWRWLSLGTVLTVQLKTVLTWASFSSRSNFSSFTSRDKDNQVQTQSAWDSCALQKQADSPSTKLETKLLFLQVISKKIYEISVNGSSYFKNRGLNVRRTELLLSWIFSFSD